MSQPPARAHKPSLLIKSLMFSGTFVCWVGCGGQKLAGSVGVLSMNGYLEDVPQSPIGFGYLPIPNGVTSAGAGLRCLRLQ